MVWYNPLSWFRNNQNQQVPKREIILYCDNPQCRLPIEEGEVAYDEENREIFHIGECGIIANAHRTFALHQVSISNVDYITTDKALELFKAGKLNQSGNLENRLVT